MPFSQACKLPTDFSHAEGVKSCLLNRAQFFPSILRDIHGLLKRTTQNGKMLLHRSADQGNILREVYRQHGASKLQDVDPRDAMSTIYPRWRSNAFCSAGSPHFSTASVLPARYRTFLAECSRHSRHGSKLTQATTRTHTFHSHVCRIFDCDPFERALRQDRKRQRCDRVFKKRPFCSGQRGGERHTGSAVYRGVTRPHPAVRRSG